MKIADIFQVSGGWRAVGRIDIASLCGLMAGPWLTPKKDARSSEAIAHLFPNPVRKRLVLVRFWLD